MSKPGSWFPRGTARLFVGGIVIAFVLAFAVTAWPFLTQNQLGTPKGGANPSTDADRTASRGAPAQSAAMSTVGKSDPAGNEDSTGARARAIKQTSRPLQLDSEKQAALKDIISRQPQTPRLEQAPFELMIGTAIPEQVKLGDIPPDVTKLMNGYWGDQYVLVQHTLVIVDQHSRRAVAIIPNVA
jgi:hypothetical protein